MSGFDTVTYFFASASNSRRSCSSAYTKRLQKCVFDGIKRNYQVRLFMCHKPALRTLTSMQESEGLSREIRTDWIELSQLFLSLSGVNLLI